MEQDIYLYPGSQSEAHRLGEAALWDASFHANVSCARDIEAVIRVYGDGRSALKPEASQMVLKRWGFKRTNFVLANTIERLGPYKEQLSAENQEWQKKAYVPPDDAHNRYFEVDTCPGVSGRIYQSSEGGIRQAGTIWAGALRTQLL